MAPHSTMPAGPTPGQAPSLPLAPALAQGAPACPPGDPLRRHRAGHPRRAGSAAGATGESPLRCWSLRDSDGSDTTSPRGSAPRPRALTDRTTGSPPMRLTGDHRMRAVRFWVSGIILVCRNVWRSRHRPWRNRRGPPQTACLAAAQVDELDQQVRVLKRLRELAARQRRGRRQGQGLGDGQQQGRVQHQVGRRQVRPQAPGLAQADGRFFLSRQRHCR